MISGRFFIILLVFISFILSTTAPIAAQTVEEFTEALMPENSKSATNTLRTRGLGGMHTQPEKPKVTLHLPFDLNSHELRSDAIVILKKLGIALQNESLRRYIFLLEGHTCDRGTDIYNMDLSHRRAMAIRNYLSENFKLDSQQFKVAWFGEKQPMVPNTDETARRKNRRVVIINTLESFDLPNKNHKSAILQIKCLRNGQEQLVQNDDTLDQNDRYAVEFRAGGMPYVYIYQAGEGEKATQLFPNKDFTQHENPIEPNRIYRVPSQMRWFYLDKDKGRERIILLANHKPLSDPQKIFMRVVDEKYVAQKKHAVQTKGVGGIHQEKPSTDGSSSSEGSFSNDTSNLTVISRYFNHH